MKFLFSNLPPVKTGFKTFTDTFYDLLAQSTRLDIAVGYISSDSLIEIKKLMELNNNIHNLNLTIGMHYLEKFTRLEYNAALELNNFLKENKLGNVMLVTSFRYHGKLYSYSTDEGAFAGIIGSDNLSSIVMGRTSIYESSILIDDKELAIQMRMFIEKLANTSTRFIDELEINDFKEKNPLLEDHEFVEKISNPASYRKTDISFDIPIKGCEKSPKSNLNVFFGKGRKRKNGLIIPRHWYEVELIVPNHITAKPGYPQSKTKDASFKVITDDGWSFKCKVSGDYSKDFRSEDDLKILGKWLKGRLEYAGVLKVGNPVTKETLEKYGRDTITLTKTTDDGVWFLDFGVKK